MTSNRVSVKPGLWTGLDCGLDWIGLTKTAIYRQWTSPRLQQLIPSSASSCFLAVESSRQGAKRSKVTCIFNELQQR